MITGRPSISFTTRMRFGSWISPQGYWFTDVTINPYSTTGNFVLRARAHIAPTALYCLTLSIFRSSVLIGFLAAAIAI
jgi:hypothetical protein